jgi:nitrogenase-associated protein
MAKVNFYEKPGCGGNTRQKALLIASGHEVEARSLRAEPWTAAALRPFFGSKPVQDWFNGSAPRVKAGEIKPGELSPKAAPAMMIDDPLLIVGFALAVVIGLLATAASRMPFFCAKRVYPSQRSADRA